LAVVRPSGHRRRRCRALHDASRRGAWRGRPARRGDPVSGTEVRVPDLGDFDAVDVIEVHVAPGDRIEKDDPLVTLETDKATMDVPSPSGGTVVSVAVEAGSKVSTGDVIVTLEAADSEAAPSEDGGADVETAASDAAPEARETRPSSADSGRTPVGGVAERAAAVPRSAGGRRIAVLGAGPGGYTAAFRAADLGLDVTLIERWPTRGGVCLNVGCIPSKALLHAARVIEETKEMAARGIEFGPPRIDPAKLRDWKNGVIGQLTRGLGSMAKQRNVRVVHGVGRFAGPHSIAVERDGETETVEFDQCIIAAGSEPVRLPGLPEDPRIMDSTGADRKRHV